MKNIYHYNSQKSNTEVEEMTDVLEDNDIGLPSKVLLFNDDWHTFDEVTAQIILAVKCSLEKAEAFTWEVHTKGKACVFDGELQECLKVSGILEEISLLTQIEFY